MDGDTQAMKGFRCQVLSAACVVADAKRNRPISPHQRARRSRKVERTRDALAVENGESPTAKLTVGTNRIRVRT